MRKIIRQREIVRDSWRYPGAAGAVAAAGTVVVTGTAEASAQVATLAEFLAGDSAAVQLEPGDDVEKLAPHVARLALVVVHFPKDGEGRGFTQGQLLRQRYRYSGELRAAGLIKRDYLFFLARCGFDAFDLHPDEDLAASLAAFKTFSAAYQPSTDRGIGVRARRVG
jgi:uncharacterized protein (DUF934 family)